MAPAEVSIYANGRLVSEQTLLSGESASVVFELGSLDIGHPVTVVIESNTFNPRREGLSRDNRELGVRVYCIDFEN